MHWISKYIGLPYLSGGRDEKGLDCWGLVFLVYRKEFGITLPEMPGVSASTAIALHRAILEGLEMEWREMEQPEDGCLVTMSQKEVAHHVGLWIGSDGNKVVHSWKGQSVLAETLMRLRYKGFRHLKYYRHFLWKTE